MHQPVVVGDARSLPAEALVDLRRRVVSAVEAGTPQVEVARLFGVSRQTVGAWVREYRARGEGGFLPGRRGRRPGEQLALTAAQQSRVARTLARHTPDQVGLRYRVWSRQAVTELINREFLVMLGSTTVGNYLARWGFPHPQDLLRELRGRNAVAMADPLRHDDRGSGWLPGAEVLWVGHGRPEWTDPAPAWPDVDLLQAVSNRRAMFFLACEDPFDARLLRCFLERLVGQLRRRVNVVVGWLPLHHHDDLRQWLVEAAPEVAVRFVATPGEPPRPRNPAV